MGIKSNKSLFNECNSSKNSFIVYHQNIRGLCCKTDDLKCSIVSNSINPHVICFTEHFMSDQKLLCNNFQNYFLGTKYARSNYQGGGVRIYIRADVDFATIDLSKYCYEKNIEICSLKIF
jgi:hypothetical protein